ncbi:MAG: pirin family protein [Dehalococcoidia bacterium]
MIKVRKADSLYYKDGGWFRSKWHFSFDEFYDPEYMGFGTLRVFNDDVLVEGAIWPMHPHRNVEALTYIPEGTFRHEDNLGNLYTMPVGSVQRMTLGKGAYHSEQNGSETEPVRFIQIWVIPREDGLEPEVESKQTTVEERANKLLRVIGSDRDGGSLLVHQDAAMYISRLEAGKSVEHEFEPDFGGYLFVISGAITVNGNNLDNGDAALIYDEPNVTIEARETSELIMMEVRTRTRVE